MSRLSMTAIKAIDEANRDLIQRNAERLQQAKEALGTKHLLHPSNAMSKEKFRKNAKVTA